MEGGASRVWLSIPPLAGVDLSITHEVLLLWLAAVVTGVLVVTTCRRRTAVPHGTWRNLVDTLVDLVEGQVVDQALGRGGRRWAPFLLTLFFFILAGNLLGMVPVPGYAHSTTSSLSVTAALALMVFAVTIAAALRVKGPGGFLRQFVPRGIPRWVRVLVVPIEVLSWLAKPVSLAIRLFANMVAGHSLLFVFIGMEMTAAWFLKPFPLAGAVAMECFELFVMLIQAFIFTMLAGMYIREAVTAEH